MSKMGYIKDTARYLNPENEIRKYSKIKKTTKIGEALGGLGMSVYVVANSQDIFVNLVKTAEQSSIPAKKAVRVASAVSLGAIAVSTLIGGLLGKAVGHISAKHQEKNN